jgi:hypothetical protein
VVVLEREDSQQLLVDLVVLAAVVDEVMAEAQEIRLPQLHRKEMQEVVLWLGLGLHLAVVAEEVVTHLGYLVQQAVEETVALLRFLALLGQQLTMQAVVVAVLAVQVHCLDMAEEQQ